MPVKFTAGSRAGCTGVVVDRCPRHGYVVVQITKGNGTYRKGARLHVVTSDSTATGL